MRVFLRKSLLLAGAAMVGGAPALAAEAAGPAESGAVEAAIVVTGSRIAKAGFEAPTPTTVVDATALNAAPQPTVAQYLNQLPALSGSTSPRTAGNGVGGGTQGMNSLNLRGLGLSRTLVLLDNRRVVGSATTGAVDLNLLPTTLLQRVDVVTGGASAAWGSDAVAGVVNLVLDKHFSGLKGNIQKGISTYGDGGELRAELAGGHAFAEGRGHILASVSYSSSDSIDRVDSRPWYVGTKLISNPAYAAGNGQPKLLVADHVNSPTGTYGGLITTGPLAGTQFLPGSVPAPFNFGTVGVPVSGLGTPGLSTTAYSGTQHSINGTPNDLGAANQISASTKVFSTFLRGSFDVTDNINLFGEFIYGKSIADSLSVPYFTMVPNGSPLTIARSNAYLPAATATAMDNAGVSSFTLGRLNMDLGEAAPHNERELYRYLVGADIKLGGSWNAHLYYEHQLSRILNEVRNDQLRSAFALAVDAVQVTPANVGSSGLALGSIVCRSSLGAPTNGCVPFNVFGPQNVTAAQRAYLVGTARQRISMTEDVASASVGGDLFNLPAGAVTLAAGAEYRRESHSADADAQSQRNITDTGPGTGNWWVGNYKPSSGGFTVKEGFAEVLVPLLKDSAIGRKLDFNGAARVTHYSTSGTVTTWKAGLTWDIAGGLKLRGVQSRDIRAPNLGDYYLGGSATSQTVIDGPNGNVSVLRIQSGNTNLVPEVASTTTLGAVYQPTFLRGFSIAVDYFRIKIDGAIATPAPQYVVDRCRDGSIPAMCSLLVRNSSGTLTTVLVQPLNYKTELMSGVDVEASYRFRLGKGMVSLRSLWTYTGEHKLIDNGVVDSLLGEVGQGNGPVKLRGFNSVSYDSESLALSLRHRFIGQGVIDAAWTSADINNNTVSAISYFDMSATAKVRSGGVNFEVFASVDNMFNAAPPRAPGILGTTNTTIGTAAATYDLIGRYFRAGVRFKM
ncbi:TonB-dependent receptor [Novosphingobium sp. SG707]|uniref:TonB-dependent receptor domain-containing protein n=1 Tax=Novosphingobium sp. SG707 TaxID=2586996 RepID=UPI001444CFB2|nr:TonB-dependent receptor [Novosphingobium sp. SG707]NKJ02220.1 outer membrane receptor protein involved in Fe transport [Novosphingobium sp. SG707]